MMPILKTSCWSLQPANFDEPSMPSLYSSVFSVASHAGKDPFTYYYNPSPPVEFGAPGIDLRVAWKDHGYATSTGNSFAAPHIAGIISLIRAKHPELTPFRSRASCGHVQPTCTGKSPHEAQTPSQIYARKLTSEWIYRLHQGRNRDAC